MTRSFLHRTKACPFRGIVQVGPVHCNTVEDIERFGKVLGEIATS